MFAFLKKKKKELFTIVGAWRMGQKDNHRGADWVAAGNDFRLKSVSARTL